MITCLVSRLIILAFGTLYPAYASYKAVRNKNIREYVKWMMYWIVFAFFTCIEACTDTFLWWFPFYYEFKVITLFWMLSPATKGSSILYRKFVHPELMRREEDIDKYINQAKEQGYSAILHVGPKVVKYVTKIIVETGVKIFEINLNKAIKGLDSSLAPVTVPQGLRLRRSQMEPNEGASERVDNDQFIKRPRAMNPFSTMAMESSGDGLRETSSYESLQGSSNSASSREPPVKKVKSTTDFEIEVDKWEKSTALKYFESM